MDELAWMALLFSGAFVLSFVVLRRWFRPRVNAVPESTADIETEEAPPPLFGAWTPVFAAQVPMTQRGKAELRLALRSAGFYRPSALIDYAALRSILVISALLLAGASAAVVPTSRIPLVLLIGLIAAALCFTVPRFTLLLRACRRARDIERGLPFAIDLLALALSAGQNALNALRQVSREVGFTHPALAEELQIVQRQAALSSLGHALQQLAERVDVAEVRNLALLLVQSERLGADASSALQEFSTHHRTNLRQQAEARANRASFWMMFPSVCCLWVAGAMLLVGPLYYEFWRQWAANAQTAKEAQKRVRIANPSMQPAASAAAPRPTSPSIP